jgi:tRNA/rRNA methyltransferase
MKISCRRYACERALAFAPWRGDDAKLADWLQQRIGLLQQRDTAMLHRLLHDIEKTYQVKFCHIFYMVYMLIMASGAQIG